MNVVDNWVEEVLYVKRVILPYEMHFEVTFKDSYGAVRTKNFPRIDAFPIWTE
jgi:hypothetical protein